MAKWGDQSKLLNIQMFSISSWEVAFLSDVFADIGLMMLALSLVSTYSLLALGSCSPVHFRTLAALVGICCVILSLLAGYGLSFAAG